MMLTFFIAFIVIYNYGHKTLHVSVLLIVITPRLMQFSNNYVDFRSSFTHRRRHSLTRRSSGPTNNFHCCIIRLAANKFNMIGYIRLINVLEGCIWYGIPDLTQSDGAFSEL